MEMLPCTLIQLSYVTYKVMFQAVLDSENTRMLLTNVERSRGTRLYIHCVLNISRCSVCVNCADKQTYVCYNLVSPVI